jgi:hypothetical protein
MAETLLTLSAPSGSYSTATSIGFSATSLVLSNRGSVPVLVRYGDSGSAVVRLEAAGEAGCVRSLTYQHNTAPTAIAVEGVGGTATVYAECSQELRTGNQIPVTITGATSTLSGANPQGGSATASPGVGTTASRADHVHPIFNDGATPEALGTAATGNDDFAARRDHVHDLPAGTTAPLALIDGAATPGTSPELSRVDHRHALPAGTTAPLALIDGAATPGTSPELSRVDHRHPLPAGTTAAANLANSASAGTSPELARVDHVHRLPTVGNYSVVRRFRFTAPATKGVAVHAAITGDDPTLSFNSGLTNPDMPRTLDVVFAAAYDGGDVTVTGTDQYDQAITETFTAVAGTTANGAKAFKTVTQIDKTTHGASTDTATVQTGNLFGVVAGSGKGAAIDSTDAVKWETSGTIAAVVVDTTNDTVDLGAGNPPNGARNYVADISVAHSHGLTG